MFRVVWLYRRGQIRPLPGGAPPTASDAAAGAARVRVSSTPMRIGGQPMPVAHVFTRGLPSGLALLAPRAQALE